REGRLLRAGRIVEKLNALGLEITLDDVRRHATGEAIGRPHVAHALVDLGLVDTFDDAFRLYLGHHARAFVPKPTFAPQEALALIRRAGGVPVLAHPGTASRDELIGGLRDAGLEGIEVWHPKHSPAQMAHYRRLAAELKLVATGGSDFHGA